MNSADSSWTQFFQVIEDLIGECKDRMCEHDYAVYEGSTSGLAGCRISPFCVVMTRGRGGDDVGTRCENRKGKIAGYGNLVCLD